MLAWCRCPAYAQPPRTGRPAVRPVPRQWAAIVAAENTGCSCLAIEIEPRYVQQAIERWQAFTGRTAVKIGAIDDRHDEPIVAGPGS